MADMGENAPDIDWSPFDQFPEQTCLCRCGTEYRTHAKALFGEPHRGLHARKPCPGCGRTDALSRASGDPERMDYSGSPLHSPCTGGADSCDESMHYVCSAHLGREQPRA